MLLLFALGSLFLLAACADIVYRAVSTVPSMADPTQQMGASSQLYDGNGQFVELLPSVDNRQPVDISQVPLQLQEAFIATEDRTFYSNIGISFRGIARATLNDMAHRGYLQGASTISQQLARTLYLSQNDTLTRKLREAVLAIELNRRYTKSEVLDMYLNDVYLGENIRGVEAAAQVYFNQPDLSQLTLPQMALLAGLPQAPASYDPFVHPQAALARRSEVLRFMLHEGYITAAQERQAQAAPLGVSKGQAAASGGDYQYPWIVDAVIDELKQAPFNLSTDQIENGGLKIYTTFDPRIEDAAVQQVQAHMTALPGMQAALAMVDQHTGDVIALVGGTEHTTALALNRATDNHRQPGSSIKPLAVYIPALENGLTAGTVVDDVITQFPSGPGQPAYLPQDDQGPYDGLTTLTEALRRSVNTVALQVLDHIGVQKGFDNAVAMGLPLNPKLDDYLPLAIGGISGTTCCSPLDMADAYATIANGGMHVTPRLITKVVGPDGRVLYSNPAQFKQVVDPRVDYVMIKMLETVTNPQPAGGWDENWGTGYDANVQDNVPGWPTAGKTGTTDNNEDAWFVGFTPLYTEAVWIGYDQPKPFPGLYGGTYAGPIFRDTMEAAVAGKTPTDFVQPQGIVQAQIDAKCAPFHVCSPSPLTPAQWIRTEWFVAGTQPTPATSANLWVQRQVTSGSPPLLWNQYCPGPPVTGVFLNRQYEPPSWAEQIAYDKGTGDWQQYIPTDQALEPPTQACSPPAGGGPGGGPTGATAQGPANAACRETWLITVTLGQPAQPPLACILAGQTAAINFVSGDGQAHQVSLPGFGQSGTLPADGSPLTFEVTPQQTGTSLILADGAPVGRLAVQAAPGPAQPQAPAPTPGQSG